jgi:DNA helicase II / ATP-dependent DNA helicase PcrA
MKSTNLDLLSGLNPEQAQAVAAGLGAILVLAGPGSGKTRVLTNRVAYLIREMGVPPYRIMAVTFTNKAANEMKERIERLLGHNIVKGLAIGTFHSICARILRAEAALAGLRTDFVIYDSDDQVALMKQVMAELNIDTERVKPRTFLSMISNAKNEMIPPEQYPQSGPQDRDVAKAYKRYDTLLRQNNAVDFDDLLILPVRIFLANPEILDRYQGYYEHLLIDEFQDTNAAQYTLIRLLAGKHSNLFCVGDPDQSIYRFRGADYRNVTRLEQDYPNRQVILLEENYRSHQIILDAAMAVIDKNSNRTRKQLHSSREDTERIAFKQLMDEKDEAQYVGWTIAQMKKQGLYHYRDCAVMFRTNAQSRALEEAFRSINIPYRLIGGIRFYSRAEVRDVLAYMRVIQNPDDTISLKRIINVPARGLGKQTITRLEAWAAAGRLSMDQALASLEDTPEAALPFAKKAAKGLIDFAAFLRKWRALRDSAPVGEVMFQVLQDTSYRDYLRDGTPEGMEKEQNVLEFLRAAESTERTLAEYLTDIALVADVDNYDEDAEGAVMLTLHAAKGLEFPVVFIVGLEDGILPHMNAVDSGDSEDLAEERRLMYVGITRAKDVLHLTWARRRSQYGGLGESTKPSRFLTDIPSELVRGNLPPPPSEYRRISSEWQPAIQIQGPTRAAPAARAKIVSLYKKGQRVRHDRFGDGTIINSVIRGSDEELDIKFDTHGTKRVSATIAPLHLLEDE